MEERNQRKEECVYVCRVVVVVGMEKGILYQAVRGSLPSESRSK